MGCKRIEREDFRNIAPRLCGGTADDRKVCVRTLRRENAKLEGDIYRLAEWEHAKLMRNESMCGYHCTDCAIDWIIGDMLDNRWLAAEEARIFGKAADRFKAGGGKGEK